MAGSGYKINDRKSTIIDLNVGEDVKTIIQSLDITPWKISVRYLGIKFTIPFTNESLINEKWVPLVDSIRHQVTKWNNLQLSWFGWAAAIKMKILLRLLFLFQSLTLSLPASRLAEVQKLLISFVRAEKKPRFRSIILQQRKEQGGLEFPDISTIN